MTKHAFWTASFQCLAKSLLSSSHQGGKTKGPTSQRFN